MVFVKPFTHLSSFIIFSEKKKFLNSKGNARRVASPVPASLRRTTSYAFLSSPGFDQVVKSFICVSRYTDSPPMRINGDSEGNVKNI